MGHADHRSILALAQSILRSSEQIVEYIGKQRCAVPLFDPSVSDLPSSREYDAMCADISEAARDLIAFVNGPKHYYRQAMMSHCDLAALQSAIGLGLFESVPETGSMSVIDLASLTGVEEHRISQVMRFLATHRVFEEVEDGVFRHTATSLVAAQDDDVRALLGYMLEDVFKASSETLDWIKASPKSSSDRDCPFTQRHGLPLFRYLDQDPVKAKRFAQGMGGAAKFDRQTRELFTEYPWQMLQRGKVVDVGGGSGHVSMNLAEQFPNLEVIVQDKSPEMLAQGLKLDIYPRVKDRVTFQQHDFFTDQPVHNADVFILRQIAHNWNDEDFVRIFRSFVPALEKGPPGAALLINDTLLPEPGTIPRFKEHSLRQLDMLMLVVLGAKQRSERQFRALLQAADPRFEVVKVSNDGSMGLIEVRLWT